LALAKTDTDPCVTRPRSHLCADSRSHSQPSQQAQPRAVTALLDGPVYALRESFRYVTWPQGSRGMGLFVK
jgi:hypothetical protein